MADFQQSIGIGSGFNDALLDGTGCINVRCITMDDVTEVTRVQTSPAHRLKLGSSMIIFSVITSKRCKTDILLMLSRKRRPGVKTVKLRFLEAWKTCLRLWISGYPIRRTRTKTYSETVVWASYQESLASSRILVRNLHCVSEVAVLPAGISVW